ncbi:type II secretion system protein [Candidatus Woesebacteria bacterium]|nr:type II secretion system protein [Candidatus Woesebacteria bacterium]
MLKPAPKKTERAYTLIEILVSLTIIGLVFGVGYISFREFARRQALAGTARSLRGNLRLAQGQALAGKKPVGCTVLNGYRFSAVSESVYRIMASCVNGDSSIGKDSVSFPDGVTMNPIPGNILFKVLGQGTDLGSDVEINLVQEATDNTIKVTVTIGGEIK